jgi:hypothetical protein
LLLNVRYFVSSFKVPGAPNNCQEIDGVFVCRNMVAAPRAWVAKSPDTWDAPIGFGAHMESESPNRMRLTATGPGIVVISEASYPAWRATVDGKAAEIMTVGGWWRAVEIGPGTHTVEMTYDPALFRAGFLIAVLALAVYGVMRRWDA